MTRSAATPWYELAFGALYPVVYAHRNEQEARRALALMSRLLPPASGPWLDLGCGQGRHLAELAALGRPTVGLDLSAPLLAMARTENAAASLIRGDMRRLPLADGSCGAVLSLFTAFGYFGSAAAHQPMVSEVARVLADGGGWCLDFLDSERVVAELGSGPRPRRRRAGPLEVREERRLEHAPRRVVKTVNLQPAAGEETAAAALGLTRSPLEYTEEVTLFTLAEIDSLAAVAGLTRLAAAGDYDGTALEPGTSDRWILVYGKPRRRKDGS